MNIYSQKQFWKYILSIAAVLIVVASFWHTNQLVRKISNEEREKVKLWAEAIQNKARLVKYTNELFDVLSSEERKKVELWAEATKKLAQQENLDDFSFILKVVADNTTVPVILSDDQNHIIAHRNFDSELAKNKNFLKEQMEVMENAHGKIEISIYKSHKNYLYYKDSRIFSELKTVMDDLIKTFISEVVVNSASVPVLFIKEDGKTLIESGNIDLKTINDRQLLNAKIAEMQEENEPIEINLGDGEKSLIYYQNSYLLNQLKYYPFFQFGVIGLFILIAYWLFSISRKAEQDQVWAGLAKETAHQLGTPLSSLMAWMELLKAQGVDEFTLTELSKDIHRLEIITERFSKIGSETILKNENVEKVLHNAINYLQIRSPKQVSFTIKNTNKQLVKAKINIPLFDWVIENLCKNAIDAMKGKGAITISFHDEAKKVLIDISDTGSGIASSKFKQVFEPGFTTKKRGWGLGLSLTKRIIESYHTGKITVHKSNENGTIFRIVLKSN